MGKVSVSVEVSKEVNDVAVLLCNVIKKLASGTSVKELISSEMGELQEAIKGISSIPGEFGEDLAAVQKAIMIPVADMVAELVKKTPAMLKSVLHLESKDSKADSKDSKEDSHSKDSKDSKEPKDSKADPSKDKGKEKDQKVDPSKPEAKPASAPSPIPAPSPAPSRGVQAPGAPGSIPAK